MDTSGTTLMEPTTETPARFSGPWRTDERGRVLEAVAAFEKRMATDLPTPLGKPWTCFCAVYENRRFFAAMRVPGTYLYSEWDVDRLVSRIEEEDARS